MKKATLEECCRELMRRGYETVYIHEIGIHQLIVEFIGDLQADGPDTDENYTIFGNVIVRIAHNWQDDAEIYIAE